jgi:hypothetical protein
MLQDIGLGKDFFGSDPRSTKIDKWNCIKLKSFYEAKEVRLNRKPKECAKIFKSPIRDYYPEYIRN